jgi:hypothetical protein
VGLIAVIMETSIGRKEKRWFEVYPAFQNNATLPKLDV